MKSAEFRFRVLEICKRYARPSANKTPEIYNQINSLFDEAQQQARKDALEEAAVFLESIDNPEFEGNHWECPSDLAARIRTLINQDKESK